LESAATLCISVSTTKTSNGKEKIDRFRSFSEALPDKSTQVEVDVLIGGGRTLTEQTMRTACDVLLTNAHVLTMDAQFSVHERGSIAIGGHALLAVGDVAAQYEANETLDCAGRIVMPGLVNAHTHAPMTARSSRGSH